MSSPLPAGEHDRSLRLAPQWTYIGTNAAGVGAIVNVGIITGRDASGRWVVLIGNDGIWGRYRALRSKGVLERASKSDRPTAERVWKEKHAASEGDART